MNTQYLFALANIALSLTIVFVSICRLNAMGNRVLWIVRLEYAGYVGGAAASAVQPYWGEWPEWGTLALGLSLLVGLLCSGRAWKGDRPPASATGPMPLHPPLPKE